MHDTGVANGHVMRHPKENPSNGKPAPTGVSLDGGWNGDYWKGGCYGPSDLLRAWFALVVGFWLFGGTLSAQVTETTGDSAAIMAAFHNWERGWEVYDAELVSRDYSDDADWTNAFGTRLIGRDSIRAFLTRIFESPALTAGETQYVFHDLRFLSPDVALLRSRAVREGQLIADGTAPVRHISHLRVFAKRDQRWVIVSHLIADERTPGQPR